MRKKRGRPAAIDRPHYSSGRVENPAHQDIASPFAAARRVALADPRAAGTAVNKAEAAAGAAGKAFGPEDAARAIAGIAVDADRASTAIGRYFLWSLHHGTKHRLTEAQYLAGCRYASQHGMAWAGLHDDLKRVSGDVLRDIVVPRRHPPAALGNHVATTPATDLNPRPKPSPDELIEYRQRQWHRYIAARETLLQIGLAVTLAVEDLVIEGHDPWWLSPSSCRLGETEARHRAAEVFHQRSMLVDGLTALAQLFGTDKEVASREGGDPSGASDTPRAPPPQATRRAQARLPIILTRDDANLSAGAIVASVNRLKQQRNSVGGCDG
jgi:hypothetical protein